MVNFFNGLQLACKVDFLFKGWRKEMQDSHIANT
jgi:hypothetical protein